MATNDIARMKDIPDQRNFVKSNVAATVVSPFTISGTSSILNLVDTNAEDASLELDANDLAIKVNTTTYIRFRGGANDDIQVDRPINFNSTVSGLTFSDITLSDVSPSITFTDTNGEDYKIEADANNLVLSNLTSGGSFLTLQGSDDTVQLQKNTVLSGSLDVNANGPLITFTDSGGDDYSIQATGSVMSINNDTGGYSFISFRGGSNDDILIGKRTRLNSDVGQSWYICATSSSNPSTSELANAVDLAFYRKSGKLVFAYNNGGTITYISIPLDGSTTTWTHNTTAP